MKYSILINSCDKFEDCWNPFFKLFATYWPDCNASLFLNTETKAYEYPSLDITSTQSCKGRKYKGAYATWSQCLRWALEQIDTDIILYMQEDYFIQSKVDNTLVEEYVDFIARHPDVPCLQLSTAGFPQTVESKYPGLFYGDVTNYSYVCCQATLWHKDVLVSLIRDYESAWNFEWYGSKRARYANLKFLTVDKKEAQRHEAIPYIKTGIIGGKWNPPVVDLFRNHNIEIDFSLRGFYNKDLKRTLSERIRFKYRFMKLRSIIEIILLRYNVISL